MKDHYHSHRMSFWLNLIPKLNSPNPQSSGPFLDHHLLPNHDDIETYEGIVRESPFKYHSHTSVPSSDTSKATNQLIGKSTNQLIGKGTSQMIGKSAKNVSRSAENKSADSGQKNESSGQLVVMDGSSVDDSDNKMIDSPRGGVTTTTVTAPSSVYSSALAAIVILGITFLLLNVIICLRLLWKEDRANQGLKRSLSGAGRKRKSSILTSLNDQVSVFFLFLSSFHSLFHSLSLSLFFSLPLFEFPIQLAPSRVRTCNHLIEFFSAML